MARKVKVRNMRNEGVYAMVLNFAVVAIVVLLPALLLRPEIGTLIGRRTMTAMYVIDSVSMMAFMYLLEKYVPMISGLYEKFIITFLSSLYTFAIMCLLNLIFARSTEKLAIDGALAAIKLVAVVLCDAALGWYFNSEKRFKKPNLLIIDSVEKNIPRMKKIKYGVLKNYNSWYENVAGMDADELREFAAERFPRFDAICIFADLSDEEYTLAVGLASDLNKDLFVVPRITDVGRTNARIVLFDDVLTLYMPKKSLNNGEIFVKRAVDIVVSTLGLVVAAVPMALIAAAIKLTSPGPVIYRQVRLTLHKREFEIYKFRTMVPDAEKLSGPKFAEKNDPRITPIGRFLRACRLDELPQLVNILKGDMTLVGPRPERPVFVKQFEQEIENYDYRFEVKAGLTGLSHVYGRYSTYIYDRTYYDLHYITHYSFLLDFKIILLTTKTMFLKSAAEGVEEIKIKAPTIKEEVKQ